VSFGEAISAMFFEAMKADEDCGGVLAYNFFSGEHIVGLEEGRPMLIRGKTPTSPLRISPARCSIPPWRPSASAWISSLKRKRSGSTRF
ncbi:MAG: hypothetical protein MJ141_04440, partial [Clostridia bacterium]|nr:hypothetical protein [Clostridia bacterium]